MGLPDYCEKKLNDYRDNVRCSARQIADFLEWFLKQEISQDSVLLIIGDHFSIDSAMIKRFMGNCQNRREIFNLLFSDKVILSDKNRHFSGLDILPTLLDAAGVEWGNKKLGLGVSLLTKNEENLIEKNGLSNLNRELMKYNKIYSSFLEDKRNQL